MVIYVVLLFIGVVYSACNSATYVDPYTSLPSAPVYPTSTLSATLTPTPSTANPLTKDHWSEVSNLAAYRPPKATITANPTQTKCPHTASGLKNWHDPATWAGAGVPTNGATVNIPNNVSVLISSCSIDPSFVFGVITVPASSKLIFGDATISISAIGFNVQGGLFAGSATCRLRNKVTITLYGSRTAQTVPASPWIKGMGVSGTIDLHGAQYFPTWTRLAMTAKANSSYIFIQDVVNWQPGQRIVITTTEMKDARDWHRNEERTIVSVKLTTLGSTVAAIQLDSPLAYNHYGGKEYQAEVALLTRNILVQGDAQNSEPKDNSKTACTVTTDGSTFPCEDTFLTGFGAHIFVNGPTAQGRFSGVEMFRVGQTNVLGRYPIHYHMIGNITSGNYQNHFVQDSSVHRSYFRCYAIHGTSGVKLTQNTAYDAIGHCYFLEDGVEENNEMSYNQAAHVHPLGPYKNPSLNLNGDGWYGQYLSSYPDTATLLLPSDMSAGCFYITNAYNDFIGNAASGGWTGFAVPSLGLPVKLHANVTGLCPANRPFRTPFRGNSAHSSGYWFRSAGAIYVGGELTQVGAGLSYNAGRSRSRDTCSDAAYGTPGKTSCATPLWMQFTDNKVFLSNRGMQNWGNRAEIVRFELHDVGLAMNVFGKVWIDKLLMECRTNNNRPAWFGGCPAAPAESAASVAWGKCNVRDFSFFQGFNGFQWYDVSQRHILTNSTFRNCNETWDRCVYGTKNRGLCGGISVFQSLTHSDQFVPELMQVTRQIVYQNVTNLWKYTTKVTDKTGITVSGKLQSWYDADGSATRLGARAMIGSTWSNDWWKINKDCTAYSEAWMCKLANNDGMASFKFSYNLTEEARIGKTLCMNGGGAYPCPVIGKLSHFGMKNESAGLYLAANPKVTGPVIGAYGGWFVRFDKGTPKLLTINSVQLLANTTLLLALPYPTGTTFQIYHKGASWCGTYNDCKHVYRPVSSVAAVAAAFGDAYYWNNAARILYIRVVEAPATFGKKGSDPAVWSPYAVTDVFSRGGQTLLASTYASIIINATNCAGFYCAPQPTAAVPAAFTLPPTVAESPVFIDSSDSTSDSVSISNSNSDSNSAVPQQSEDFGSEGSTGIEEQYTPSSSSSDS